MKISSRKQAGHVFIVQILFLLTLWLGIMVVTGWQTGNMYFVQVHPAFAHMQHNTALGFLLSGLGLLIFTFARTKFGIICSWLVFFTGTLTLVEYAFAIDLGIDQLFIEDKTDLQAEYPGRMAPNTAFCFMLTGLAMLYAHLARPRPGYYFILKIFGFLILMIAGIALAGYMTGIQEAYDWNYLARMAVHTATGFTMLSAGLIILSSILPGRNE